MNNEEFFRQMLSITQECTTFKIVCPHPSYNSVYVIVDGEAYKIQFTTSDVLSPMVGKCDYPSIIGASESVVNMIRTEFKQKAIEYVIKVNEAGNGEHLVEPLKNVPLNEIRNLQARIKALQSN